MTAGSLLKNPEGWYIPVPNTTTGGGTPLTGTALSQIVYVSSTGSDPGRVWRRENVAPNSIAEYDTVIGPDPRNPLQPNNVQPYASISGAGNAHAQLRSGSPDWMLLKRGDTFTWNFTLTHVKGMNEQNRTIYSWYTPTHDDFSDPRPKLNITGTSRDAFKEDRQDSTYAEAEANSTKHVAWIGWYFYAVGRDDGASGAGGEAWGIYSRAGNGSDNFLIEDCAFEYLAKAAEFNDWNEPGQPFIARYNIQVRRCFIANQFGDDKVSSGFRINSCPGCLVEDCFFDHNGWYDDGNGRDSLWNANQFNHSFYLSGDRWGSPDVIIRNTYSLRASANACQMRSGGTFEDGVVQECPLGPYGGNNGTNNTVTTVFRRNACLYRTEISSSDNSAGGLRVQDQQNGIFEDNVEAHVRFVDPEKRAYSYRALGSGHSEFRRNTSYDQNPSVSHGDVDAAVSTVTVSEDNIWQSESETNGVTDKYVADVTFKDTTRDLETYFDMIDGGPPHTLDSIQDKWRNQRYGNWRTDYEAKYASEWIRAGYREEGEEEEEPDPVAMKLKNPILAAVF